MSDSNGAEVAEIRRSAGIADDPPHDDRDQADQLEPSEPLPEIPRFPVDKLVGPLRSFVEWGVRDGLHAEAMAAAGLSALATLTGSARLKLTAVRIIKAIVWVALVGVASAGKSPAYEHAFKIIRDVYKDKRTVYQGELADWFAEVQEVGRKKAGPPPVRPEPFEVDDATTEAVARWLTARGADASGAVIDDELAAFLEGLNQYKGGQGPDLSKWLKMWTGAPLHIQRVGSGGSHNEVSLYIPDPVVSISGPLVPENLHLLGRPGSGFRPRWLPFYAPARKPEWNDAGAYPDDWTECIKRLIGNREERQWTLSTKARNAWASASNRWERWQDRPEPDDVIEALRKADTQALRIALVLAASAGGTSEQVSAEVMTSAIAIVDYCINVWRALPANSTMIASRREDVMDTAHRRLVAWLESRPLHTEGLPEGSKPRPGASRREVQLWLHEPAKKLNDLILEHRDRWPDCVVSVKPEHGGRQTVWIYAPPRMSSDRGAMLPQHRSEESEYLHVENETPGRSGEKPTAGDVARDVASPAATSVRNIAPAVCAVCRSPLDPALADLGETTHATCDPDEAGRAA